MQVFDILMIAFGVMTGALLAAIPPQTEKNPSLVKIFAFGVAIAGYLMIGAIAAEGGQRFVGTLVLSLIGAAVGFAAIYGTAVRKPHAQPTSDAAGSSPTRTARAA